MLQWVVMSDTNTTTNDPYLIKLRDMYPGWSDAALQIAASTQLVKDALDGKEDKGTPNPNTFYNVK